MADNFFAPPQAYTREMLNKAYEWLKSQPKIVQERATNTDTMVSLYLHHRRVHGMRTTPAEANSPSVEESFKTDLKAVAEGLRQFEEPVVYSPQVSHQSVFHPPPPPESLAPPLPQTPPPPISAPKISSPPHKSPGFGFLDARTQQMANDVRERLNLSHDDEAIRMLVVIGYERLQGFLTGRS